MYTVKIAYGLQQNPKAGDIRIAVFVREQGFVNEFDTHEENALHLVVFEDGQAVATARAYQRQNSTSFILGRVAVLPAHRGRGVGAMAVTELEEYLRQRAVPSVELLAQVRARGFYEKLGYAAVSETEELEEGVPHIRMGKRLCTTAQEVLQ